MAMSSGSLESKVKSNLTSRGFSFSGTHTRAPDLAKAVGVGVVGEIQSSAKVMVTTHAGGTFKVSGLSAGGMASKIKGSLSGSGFKFAAHSRADVIPSVISAAVTAEILSKCSVAIPYDGAGTFQIVGMSASALESAIISGLRGKGFNTGAGESSAMAYAVAKAVADEVNGNAVVSGGFASGGVFPVL